jgi:hypothetical protein
MNYIEKLNYICANEHFDTDNEFAARLNKVYNEIPKNELVNHNRSSEIITRRIENYCKNNNIKLEDYNGPLPFRFFIIPQSKDFNIQIS